MRPCISAGRGILMTQQQARSAILAYRRGARSRLMSQINTLEKYLLTIAQGFFPLRPQLSGPNRDYTRMLREVVPDTRPRAFMLRYSFGGGARVSFWSHRPSACGIDELQDALGCQYDSHKSGQLDSFEEFVQGVDRLRQLRRRIRGMIKYGLQPGVLVADHPAEAWLDELLLSGTPAEALARVIKEIQARAYRIGDESEQLERTRWYDESRGDEEALAALLSEEDQAFWSVLGLSETMGWGFIVAMSFGLTNSREGDDTSWAEERLAQVTPIGKGKARHGSRARRARSARAIA